MVVAECCWCRLREKIPENAFVQELRERMKNSAGGFEYTLPHSPRSQRLPRPLMGSIDRFFCSDVWDSTAEAAAAFPPLPQAPTRTPTPPQAFPSRQSTPTSDESDGFFSGDINTAPGRSPFFMFGGRGESNSDGADARDRELPPLSRDPYAAYPSASADRSSQARPNGVVKRDEDEYFFGVPSDEGESVARATSWEEIRRRAAQREQGRK